MMNYKKPQNVEKTLSQIFYKFKAFKQFPRCYWIAVVVLERSHDQDKKIRIKTKHEAKSTTLQTHTAAPRLRNVGRMYALSFGSTMSEYYEGDTLIAQRKTAFMHKWIKNIKC